VVYSINQFLSIYIKKNIDKNYGAYIEDIIADIQYGLSLEKRLRVQRLNYFYNVTKTGFNIDELSDNVITFVDDLRDVFNQTIFNTSINNEAEIVLLVSKVMSFVIIFLVLIFCTVLILLSIGSLANSIMISVDKNKKFIGLLKALGLNEKDLKSVIRMESFTTICLGVILAFLTILIIRPLLANLNTILINTAFIDYLLQIDYQIVFKVPVYIPLIVIVFYIAFTLIFARGSMSKIVKTDPMAVISEVA
jgi:ABC-type antimicrobial peptide transport system permease subunit